MPVFHLIRHGQASFGAADYDVLSDIGHQQAKVLADTLVRRGVRPDRIVAGSLRRHRDTAVTCAEAAVWDLPVGIDPRLDEYNYRPPPGAAPVPGALPVPGSVLGDDGQDALDVALLDWATSGRPGADGVTFEQWRSGVLAAQRDFIGSFEPGTTGVVFTSGGVISVIVADLLGLGPEGFVALSRVTVNTAITKLVSGRRGTTLISFNDHAHLEGPADLLTYR